MSPKRRNNDTTTLRVLRSSGQKDECTLKDFKVAISESEKLGQIPVDCLRVFHLGRELKTPGRSLEALGVGREGFSVVHIHAPPTPTASSHAAPVPPLETMPVHLNNLDHASVASVVVPAAAVAESPEVEVVLVQDAKRQASAMEAVVDLADDSDDDDCVVVESFEAAAQSDNKRPRRHA